MALSPINGHKRVDIRKLVGSLLTICSLGLLYLGVTQPIFKLTMSGSIKAQLANLDTSLLDQEKSIIETVADLWHDGRLLVASLIAFFSIGIPIIKSILMLISLHAKNFAMTRSISKFLAIISRWSMADVFVVAVFLAWLSTKNQVNTSRSAVQAFGFDIPIEITTVMTSDLGPGFYYFTAYCLLSLLLTYFPKTERTQLVD